MYIILKMLNSGRYTLENIKPLTIYWNMLRCKWYKWCNECSNPKFDWISAPWRIFCKSCLILNSFLRHGALDWRSIHLLTSRWVCLKKSNESFRLLSDYCMHLGMYYLALHHFDLKKTCKKMVKMPVQLCRTHRCAWNNLGRQQVISPFSQHPKKSITVSSAWRVFFTQQPSTPSLLKGSSQVHPTSIWTKKTTNIFYKRNVAETHVFNPTHNFPNTKIKSYLR